MIVDDDRAGRRLVDVAQHAEVLQGEHRHLRVGDRARRRDVATSAYGSSAVIHVTTAHRVGAGDDLHLGEQPAQRLGVQAVAALPPARRPRGAVGPLDAADGEAPASSTHGDLVGDRRPGRRRRRPRRPRLDRVGGEQLGVQRPHGVSAASSRRRDSSVPWARVRNQRPA